MPAWLYVCKSCGSTHEAPLRPGGTVYLRCLTTREWSWYEPTVFTLPGEPRVRAGARVGSSRAGAPRKGTAERPAWRVPRALWSTITCAVGGGEW